MSLGLKTLEVLHAKHRAQQQNERVKLEQANEARAGAAAKLERLCVQNQALYKLSTAGVSSRNIKSVQRVAHYRRFCDELLVLGENEKAVTQAANEALENEACEVASRVKAAARKVEIISERAGKQRSFLKIVSEQMEEEESSEARSAFLGKNGTTNAA